MAGEYSEWEGQQRIVRKGIKRKNYVVEVEIHRYWEVKPLLGKFFAIRVFKSLLEKKRKVKGETQRENRGHSPESTSRVSPAT